MIYVYYSMLLIDVSDHVGEKNIITSNYRLKVIDFC